MIPFGSRVEEHIHRRKWKQSIAERKPAESDDKSQVSESTEMSVSESEDKVEEIRAAWGAEDKFIEYLKYREEKEREATDAREERNQRFMERLIDKMQDNKLEEQARRKEISEERELRQKATPIRQMEEKEDVVEYIELFEENMETRKVPRHMWASNLKPLLNSACRVAVNALSKRDRVDYDRIREEVLGTCPELYRMAGNSFFNTTKEKGETIQNFIRRMHRLCGRFAGVDTKDDCCEQTQEECLRKVTTERILQFLPIGAAGYVRERKPESLRALGTHIEEYFVNRRMSIMDYTGENQSHQQSRQYSHQFKFLKDQHQQRRPWNQPSRTNQGMPEVKTSSTLTREEPEEVKTEMTRLSTQSSRSYKDSRCYKCGQQGHFARSCSSRVNLVCNGGVRSTFQKMCEVSGVVAGQKFDNILIDSGADVSVISEDLVPEGTPTTRHTMWPDSTDHQRHVEW